MPKILIILFVVCGFQQANSQVKISPIKGSISSNNSEINFIQINDSLAFFTQYYFIDRELESKIFQAKKINEAWYKTENNSYNFKEGNSGNYCFASVKNISFFNICSHDFSNCDIYKLEDRKVTNLRDLNSEAFNNKYNAQPHFFSHNNKSFLAFVSDRKGGFGGLDIWISVIDKSGNIGMPINAGPKINSPFNEITPFYNKHESKLYFSSNTDTNNIGGYDIYFSVGYPNMWGSRENKLEFNTEKDEMYFSMYNNIGYISSNRNSDCKNIDSCCANIYEVIATHENTAKTLIEESFDYTTYLPLNLYFDNDKPSKSDFDEDVKFNYKNSYIDYFMKLDKYLLYNDNNIELFFEDSLKENFNKLNRLLEVLYDNLQNGYIIKIKIRGYASQLAEEEYNIDLSSLRIRSLVNYIAAFKNGSLNKYLINKSLKIIEVPLGESQSVENKNQNTVQGIYGIDAMINRKVSILKIDAYK